MDSPTLEPADLRSSISVRQPVSCEPCRQRKIKCSRTRPICDTCRRRRCSERCIYKSGNFNSIPYTSHNSNNELLNRISNLEDLLRKHTGAVISTQNSRNGDRDEYTSSIPSPPFDISYGSQLTPLSIASFEASNRDVISGDQVSPRNRGVLTASPNGNVRYELGASQWTAVLANTNLSIATPSLDDQEDTHMNLGFPLSSAVPESIEDLLSLLPPMAQCNYLKNQYFIIFSPLFHILHDPTFHAQYAQLVESPASVTVSWLAILFVLLSLAVTGLEDSDPVLRDLARDPEPCRNIRFLSKRYRDAAMKCLIKQGVFWGKHNVQSLQAMIMLIYAMSHSQEHTWVLLGMTHNIAIALACHVDPSTLKLNPIECEERRRCWAGLMMQYTIQNTVLGNPDPNWHTSYSVNLPADVDDTSITISGIQESFVGPTQMTYLLFKFKLYNLTAQICRETFSTSEPDRSSIQNLDQQICLAQETWDSRYLADSSFDALPVHHAVHVHILHGYAHQLFLLLHRPFFAQSIMGLEIPNESQIRCIASAEALLDIHRTLSEKAEFRPYMWYTNGLGSFHAFHAAAVLAVALLMPIYKPQYRKFKCILDDTLLRFEGASGRSKVCAKATKILRFLLAAPSPNQPSSFNLGSRSDERITWLNDDQMRLFTERLQPQQWLGPSTMAWNEWDNIMNTMDNIRA